MEKTVLARRRNQHTRRVRYPTTLTSLNILRLRLLLASRRDRLRRKREALPQ